MRTAIVGILAAFLSAVPGHAESLITVKAPELDGAVAWLNTSGPIRLADLRGKVVVLDFWTFCCINCIHTLPDLAKLEKKFERELVVVGVHSAKFDNEKKTDAIRKAILRYQITHPVANDAEMRVWNRYRIDGWPTLVVIDPEGNIVSRESGEGQYDRLDRIITGLIAEHGKKGTLDRKPIRFDLVKELAAMPLYFPGKVLADGPGNRLFIADSTHHRVVITDLSGNRVAVAGTGEAGHDDGSFEKATFNDPQGLALDGDVLYVADRKNHLIRALDLKARTVRRFAGTGEQDRGSRRGGGPAKAVRLNSPWDICLVGRTLYIAMAGHHQIWALDLDRREMRPFAGSGREDVNDGPRLTADLAQPSGLTSDGNRLYFADSESSTVRTVDLKPDGHVSTVVGKAGDRLFNFGDKDGAGDKVRLQHALGVVYHDGRLYVADTYNSKIKAVDPVRRTCVSWLGGGPGEALNEPAGLTVAGGKLYIADTNAHRIRVVDLATKAISNLELKGVEPPGGK